jgi:hypothetical protein
VCEGERSRVGSAQTWVRGKCRKKDNLEPTLDRGIDISSKPNIAQESTGDILIVHNIFYRYGQMHRSRGTISLQKYPIHGKLNLQNKKHSFAQMHLWLVVVAGLVKVKTPETARPAVYHSCVCNLAQSNYPVHEQELLALQDLIKSYEYWLVGKWHSLPTSQCSRE